MTAENETPLNPDLPTSQPIIEKRAKPSDRASTMRGFAFDSSFWLTWMGTSIVAIVLSLIFYSYNMTNSVSGTPFLIGLFAAVAGVASLIQWFFFRDRLAGWWIAANTAAGVALGLLHNYVKYVGWWWEPHLGIALVLWLVGNYVTGLFLLGKIQEGSKNSASFIETGARQNIFLLLLSISLVVASIANILLVRDLYEPLLLFWKLYGIAAILASISFILKKDIPKNFGFISLAIFLLFDGINVERLAFNSDYPLYYFALNGITALVSGIYFVSRGENWKNFGFILLSGYLILTGIAGISVDTQELSYGFLILSTLFAVPAAVFLLLRK